MKVNIPKKMADMQTKGVSDTKVHSPNRVRWSRDGAMRVADDPISSATKGRSVGRT